MKRFLFCILLLFFTFNLFAMDLSSVKTGDSKSSLIKNLGKPFKEIKGDGFEYDIWLDNEEIWIALLENEKLDNAPMRLEDILSSLLEMYSIFDLSDDQYFSDILDSLSSETTTSLSSISSPTELQSEADDKIDKTLLGSTEITILDSKIINKNYDPEAGFRLKVKNNGTKEISKLKVILYFYDKKGKIFFEDSRTLIDSESYFSDTKPLKPNYSILIPKSSSSYYTVSGMDLDEWDEGKVSFKIVELK